MASAKAVTWIIISTSLLGITTSQTQLKQETSTFEYNKICTNMLCNNTASLMRLRNCTVVLGYLQIVRMEEATAEYFKNVSFPELREVTGFVVLFRVYGLESLGQLFPNLGRIRGAELIYNFALIIFDLPDLLEIGLYSLLKIDRGGVIVWGGIVTCYTDTIHWEHITNDRHFVFPFNTYPKCNVICSCSTSPAMNLCWNNKKCQRLLEGPEAEQCDSQCFGCKKSNPKKCSLCRNYTHKNRCVSECPRGTIVLQVNKYCVTEEECNHLGGWSWNNSCMFECPQKYIERNVPTGITCQRCDNCKQTCESLQIHTLENIQSAERCVYINGSLTIAIRPTLPEALDEMRHYLSVIQEVTDYVLIYDSISISSLDFLSSLRRIGGRKLLNGTYSLSVSGMHNLQSLFIRNVTQNLRVDKGTFTFYDNPMLCLNHIEELKAIFPQPPSKNDIPPGMNGYSGGCEEILLQLRVEVINETSAVAIFNQVPELNVHYSILYVRIPQGSHETLVPETCSESEWYAVSVPDSKLINHTVYVEISSLRPASSYALCIETYNPIKVHLARSSIVNFNTIVGKPEPPFIIELVAKSSFDIVIRWVDHVDYRPHINRYELDVNIIEISSIDIAARDQCVPVMEDMRELDYSRHVVVMRPPKNYEKGCESMCGILSTIPVGAIIEEYFDVCSTLELGCNEDENFARPSNATIGTYVRTLALNLSSPKKVFQVGNMAPFRDYRFQLRACVADKCSRYRSGVVRTLRSDIADVPRINSAEADSSGVIRIQWRPPVETNGPVLSYNIEIMPVIPDMEHLFPRVWCVSGNETNFVVTDDAAKSYGIRVCSNTLGSNYICSSSMNVVVPQVVAQDIPTWWWVGFPVGIIFYIISLAIGWLEKRGRKGDELLLIDVTVTYANETDPPSRRKSDVPLYTT